MARLLEVEEKHGISLPVWIRVATEEDTNWYYFAKFGI